MRRHNCRRIIKPDEPYKLWQVNIPLDIQRNLRQDTLDTDEQYQGKPIGWGAVATASDFQGPCLMICTLLDCCLAFTCRRSRSLKCCRGNRSISTCAPSFASTSMNPRAGAIREQGIALTGGPDCDVSDLEGTSGVAEQSSGTPLYISKRSLGTRE